uniref:Uncharacterized protein n=1 Tax=Solanum tuberosum TaxID=4113 RepID=M1CYJ6_SOLTU
MFMVGLLIISRHTIRLLMDLLFHEWWYILGKGVAKYFDKDEARKRVHQGESIVWNATILSRPHPTNYIADGKAPELELAYFMSLRFNYLPLMMGDKSQDIEKTLSKVKTPLAPQHQSKKLNSSKVSKKEVVQTSTDKEKCPQFLFSSKRALQETSKTSKDQCWNRQRDEPSGAEVVDLRVVEVQSVDSPSRSMTIQSDKANVAGHPLGSPHERPQVSDESTAITKPKAKSISNIEQEQKTSSTSRGQTLKGLTPNSNELPRVLPKSNGAMSVFEGKGVVFNHKMKYTLGLWEEICGKLSRTSLDNISSYKDDICEIFKEMSEMNLLDLSPLKSLHLPQNIPPFVEEKAH